MFNEYENIVTATIALVRQLQVKVNNKTVDDVLQNHPYYPSLLSISDALATWHIDNASAKIDVIDISQLPVPFIAYTYFKEHNFVLVNKVKNDSIEVFTKSYHKAVELKKDEFLQNWNGVYLLAEANKFSGEKSYEQNKFKQQVSAAVPILSMALISVLSFVMVCSNLLNIGLTALPYYLQYFIFLAGVIVTTMLLWYEIDRKNPVLHKVCTGIIKGNCNAILTGKASKIFSWLSWSEVGFFYFVGSFLCIVFNPFNSVTYAFSFLALPYIIFSIYYQGVIAKEWCLFCLSVQALLLLGGINIIFNHLFNSSNILDISNITNALLLYLLPVALWYSIKPVVLKLQADEQTKRAYLRLKFNTEIFETLLSRQKFVSSVDKDLGIDIGNPFATNTIIKVCNPYCGPCANVHPKIEMLLAKSTKIKAKIIFIATNHENDYRAIPVKHLLAIAQKGNQQLTRQALDDWYLAEEKDYDVFAKKYPINGELLQQNDKINEMEKWCKAADIQYTPTIFINGYQLPDVYNIEDLEYFLLE